MGPETLVMMTGKEEASWPWVVMPLCDMIRQFSVSVESSMYVDMLASWLDLLGGGLDDAAFVALLVLPRTKRRTARASPCPAAPCMRTASMTKATKAMSPSRISSLDVKHDRIAVGSTLPEEVAFPFIVTTTSL
jgi:hypothetical protein